MGNQSICFQCYYIIWNSIIDIAFYHDILVWSYRFKFTDVKGNESLSNIPFSYLFNFESIYLRMVCTGYQKGIQKDMQACQVTSSLLHVFHGG